MMLNCVVFNCESAMCEIVEFTDDFDGFKLHFTGLCGILPYPVFLDETSSEIELCIDFHTLFA